MRVCVVGSGGREHALAHVLGRHHDVVVTPGNPGIPGSVPTPAEELDSDLVISAVGLRPRTELAAAAGLETQRGIVVNRALETSAPDIYALGDCAEVDGHVLLYVLPLMACARALAKTLVSEPTEVKYGTMPVMVKTPCCPTAVCPPPANASGSWEVDADGQDVRALFKSESGEVLGFAVTGGYAMEKQALSKEVPPIHD
jgi:rubredoxin-NAD+ reductase